MSTFRVCLTHAQARTVNVSSAIVRKDDAMEVPSQLRPALWGAVGGAIAVTIIGFSWGGWVTGSTARKDAATAAHDAVVVALAPICADRFRAQGDSPAKIAITIS